MRDEFGNKGIRQRHLSSEVFYRYKSASREIAYSRKSVSKLILFLSPIKCHFLSLCFSSSVILKCVSIAATITNNKTSIFSYNKMKITGAQETNERKKDQKKKN